MRYWEISGNLDSADGLANYDLFESVVVMVKQLFDNVFGIEHINKVRFLVDNAVSNSGPTPICTCVLREFVIIKLCICDTDGVAKITFQFAHELMHVVFFAYCGLDKPYADDEEESICAAASLLALKVVCPESLDSYVAYLRTQPKYSKGVDVAELVDYEWARLRNLVGDVVSRKKGAVVSDN